MTRTLVRVLIAGVAAGVLIAGCGSDSEPSAKPESSSSSSSTSASVAPTSATQAGTVAAAPAGKGAVTVKQFQFMPAELVVKTGTEVTWTNEDDILHTATSGATPGTSDGQFDGPMDGKGKSFSHVFGQSGRYPYFCNRHNSMTGTIVVE
jgi:plastocyanin